MIVALAGLPGSGKSFFAKELVKRDPNFIIYSKDDVRDFFFPGPLTDFSSQQNDLCMKFILMASEYLLSKNDKQVIILDGRTFSSSNQVATIIEASRTIGTPYKFILFRCSEETARKRITAGQGIHLAKDRNMDLYYSLKEKADPLTVPHLVLETDNPDLLEDRINRALTYIFSE